MPVDGDVRRDPAAAQVLDVRPSRRRPCRTPLAANHSAQRHRFAHLGWTIGRPVGESQLVCPYFSEFQLHLFIERISMTKQRLSTADRMSGSAAILAFVACFAVVLSPSFFAILVMVASERPWGIASKAEPTPAAIFRVMQEKSEEVRTAAANPPAPDETGRELLQLMRLRSTVRPHTEPAASHPEDPVPVSNPVEPIGVAAPVLAPA